MYHSDTTKKDISIFTMSFLSNDDHAPLNGFQSKTIVGDIRFKLVEQLRSAGLQATPYAQACIINMAREMRPMPQMRSSIFAPRIQP